MESLRARYGTAVEIAADVLVQPAGRLVTAVGLLARRHEHDIGEVARQIQRPVGHGTAASEQFAEEHAERIDVRGFRDPFAAGLLGAGIFRGHRGGEGNSGVAGGREVFRVEDFGDPEVEEFGRAVAGHENVAGLDIAMHHAKVVCKIDRAAHDPEETRADRAG